MSSNRCSTAIYLAIVALAAAACATPTQQPIAASPFSFSESEQLGVERVIVVTDASSSMRPNRFAEAKALTQSVVAGLPEQSGSDSYDVSLVSFGGSKRVSSALAPLDRDALTRQAADLEPLGGIPSLGGTTPMHSVFDELGSQLAGTSGRSAIVLISDGRADDPGRALAAAKQLQQAGSGDVCFHAVQVGDSRVGRSFTEQFVGLSDCGSLRTADQIASATDVASLERQVFAIAALPRSLPPVAAAPPCERTVALDEEVLFAFDSAEISPEGIVQIDALAVQLNECVPVRVVVGGHTDGTGPAAYNEDLSERRAEAVRKQLIEAGISDGRLVAEGFGMTDPFTSNDTRQGRAANRRVELEPIR